MSGGHADEIRELKDDVETLSKSLAAVIKRIQYLETVEAGARVLNGDQGPGSGSQPGSPGAESDHDTSAREDKAGTQSGGTRTVITTHIVTKSTSYVPVSESQDLLKNSIVESPTSPQAQLQLGLRKSAGDDHLGLVLEEREGQLVVVGVKDSCPLGKNGLVAVGDVIVAVNGRGVATAGEFSDAVKNLKDGAMLTIIPVRESSHAPGGDYIKACFDYDPQSDDAVPCKEIGLRFQAGDILQVISKEDPKWWQARKVSDWSRTGLIPSRDMEEGRRAHSHAKATTNEKSNTEELETRVYEAMAKMSPYGRKVLVLLGAPGVGRRTLKSRLLQHSPNVFVSAVPYTSRKAREHEKDGREYRFTTRAAMEKEIQNGNFLEWGEYNGNFYGTKIDSVKEAIRNGKLCILDCSPQALKQIYSKNFMPFVVLITPPPLEELSQLHRLNVNLFKSKSDDELKNTCDASASLEKLYKPYVDLTLVNRNAEVTFRRVLDGLEALKTQNQWVPASWLFD